MHDINYLVSEFDRLKSAPGQLDFLRFIVQEMGFFKSPIITQKLAEALDHPDQDVKLLAIQGLGNAKCRQAVPKLKELLYSSDSKIMNTSLHALLRIEIPDITDTLIPFFKPGAEPFNMLFRLLTDRDCSVSSSCSDFIEEALLTLADNKTPEAIAILKELVLHPFHPQVLEPAIKALAKVVENGQPQDPGIADCFLSVIHFPPPQSFCHETPFTKVALAMLALLKTDDPRALPTLRDFFARGEPNAIIFFLEKLGTVNDPLIIQEIMPLLNHRSLYVKKEACCALGKAKAASAIEAIKGVLLSVSGYIPYYDPEEDRDPERNCIIDSSMALVNIQGPDAAPTIIEALKICPPRIVEYLIPSLELAGGHAAIEFLLQQIEGRDLEYKLIAIKSLGYIKNKNPKVIPMARVVPLLTGLLNSDDQDISNAASLSLAHLCHLLSPEDLNMLLTNQKFKHSLDAAEVLAKSGHPKGFEIIREEIRNRLSQGASMSDVVSSLEKIGGPYAAASLIELFRHPNVGHKDDILRALSFNRSEASATLFVDLLDNPHFCFQAAKCISKILEGPLFYNESPEARQMMVGFLYEKIGKRLPPLFAPQQPGYQIHPDILVEMVLPHLSLNGLRNQALINRATCNLVKQHLALRGRQSRAAEDKMRADFLL